VNWHDKGDTVRCTGTFTDSDGTAADPTAVLFQFKDPSGNAATYTYGTDAELVKSGIGVYYVDVDADEAGTWVYRFYATGTGKSAAQSTFGIKKSEFD